MQQITEAISKGTDAIKNKSGDLVEYLKQNPRLASMLLAGGGAGLAGGLLTSATPEREGETKGSRRLRILRNALLTGAAGAGAAGLGSEAFKRVEEAIPADQPHPLSSFLTSPLVRTAGGAGGALAGVAAGAKGDIDDALVSGIMHLKDKSPGNGPLSTFKEMHDKVSPAGRANFVKNHLPAGTSITHTSPLNQLANMVKNEKVRATLQKALGGRARQLGVLGGAAGFFAPELFDKATDTLAALGE